MNKLVWIIVGLVVIGMLVASAGPPMPLGTYAKLNDERVRDSNARLCNALGSRC
jgi:hypothetical protein